MADNTTKFNNPPDPVSERESEYSSRYANTFKGYNVDTLEYPNGLRDLPDLQHYLAFYINVREKSTLFEENRQSGRINYEDSPRGKDRTTAISTGDVNNLTNSIIDNNKAAGVAGAAVGGLIGLQSVLKSKNSFLGAIGKVAGGALKGGALAYGGTTLLKYARDQGFFSGAGFSSGRTFRLSNVITLYLEERPSVRYGINYANEDIGSLAGLLTVGAAAGSLAAARQSGFPEEAGQAILRNLVGMANLGSGRGAVRNFTELGTRTRLNPFREVFFESVDYRTFNFRYRFFPKDESETKKIQEIIKTFKMHMHPELSRNKLFYVYPSEFQLRYFYKDKENQYLHKFAPCVLTDMQVDYGGDQFATFQNGAPVEIGLTLTFRELEQVTAEGAKRGL
jgi:hypothetical protein